MKMSDDVEKRVEAYLRTLRARLYGVAGDDVRDIVAELRSHIIEKAAQGGEVSAKRVEAALAALGSPEELARQYMADELLARAAVSRSPVQILESLFRWASLSFAGFSVLLATILGYFLGLVLFLCAVLKPFHPQTAGLWVFPDRDDFTVSLRLGFESAPPGSREVLGWWVVPAGLVAGCGLVILTTRFALWCAMRYRNSRVMPRG